ncbi:MAG: SprT protein [Glaciecola sp.]|jgi:SprT protein
MTVQLLDKKQLSPLMSITISSEITSWINHKISEENIRFKMVKARKRKLGDYRFNPITKEHQITINSGLEESLFFLTFIHELAHKKTFDNWGRRIQPHGQEWKICFQNLLIEGLKVSSNPDVQQLLKASALKPRARIHIKDESYTGLTVANLKTNDNFKLNNSKVIYTLKEKRRKRYNCIAIMTNKKYSISPDAQVTKCN